jgi:hypothetical protein
MRVHAWLSYAIMNNSPDFKLHGGRYAPPRVALNGALINVTDPSAASSGA